MINDSKGKVTYKKRKFAHLRQDFIVSVLNSSVTRRDAKSYIQRFAPPTYPDISNFVVKKNDRGKLGNSLAEICGPAVVQRSPKFMLQLGKLANNKKESYVHLALIKIRALQHLSDKTIDGICLTISQLFKLGLKSIVVLDLDDETGPRTSFNRRVASRKKFELEQASRVISAIENCGIKARLMDSIIGINENTSEHVDHHTKCINLAHPELLIAQLRLGVIPVLLPSGYSNTSQISFTLPANEIVMALVRELFGQQSNSSLDKSFLATVKDHRQLLKNDYLLDRLILLDPLGGIPNPNSPNGHHVFLNMEQEYEEVKRNLSQNLDDSKTKATSGLTFIASNIQNIIINGTSLTNSEKESKSSPLRIEPEGIRKISDLHIETLYHLENLTLTRSVLSMLPLSSSALLVSPEQVANTIRPTPYHPDRVGTRRQINPLIHNLLADKPVFSSSLPSGRRQKNLPFDSGSALDSVTCSMTFSKHGMPVTIFPDPKDSPWSPRICENSPISLTDPKINLSSLINLINDSFGRMIDVPAYLSRVNHRIAGVIVAGDYEGGAIFTWETPPGVDPSDTTRMVPYLDKLAVLRRSQGSGCVADLIYNCMSRKCFPNGVVWRSRKNNPVNKWYFERSQGTWKLPGTDWTMFWTTPNLTINYPNLLFDYEAVCRTIQPTWLDSNKKLD